MQLHKFVEQIHKLGIETVIGVPDSALKPFCDYMNRNGEEFVHHYVPANEGAAVGLAIGSYLATGKASCVYMQNSGIGNTVNPLTSLANGAVYGIPMLLVIGWRGEPQTKDEPQHKFMGNVTTQMLKLLEVDYGIIGSDTSEEELDKIFAKAKMTLADKRQFAIVVRRGCFDDGESESYQNSYTLGREEAIREIILNINEEDVLVSTTGKISREVYEQSDELKGQHAQDFLTVGGMGHASMIALGFAKERPEKTVYCLDGDGAVLMHMGSLAFIAKQKPDNLIHICLNNEAHESVGGMPTGGTGLRYADVAESCGYPSVYKAETLQQLQDILNKIKEKRSLTFLEIMVSMASRSNLGRPKETAEQNKYEFMKYHGEIK